MAEAYHELKQYPEEIEVCNQALRVDPKSRGAFEHLANAYAETARFEDAAAVLKRAIIVCPDVPHLRAWLAQSYVELGDLQSATVEQRALQKIDLALAADIEKLIAAKAGRLK